MVSGKSACNSAMLKASSILYKVVSHRNHAKVDKWCPGSSPARQLLSNGPTHANTENGCQMMMMMVMNECESLLTH